MNQGVKEVRSVEHTESMFEERASNVDWVVLFIISNYESRWGNVIAPLDKDPSGGSARTMFADLFSFCLRAFCPALRTPCEGIFLFIDKSRIKEKTKQQSHFFFCFFVFLVLLISDVSSTEDGKACRNATTDLGECEMLITTQDKARTLSCFLRSSVRSYQFCFCSS